MSDFPALLTGPGSATVPWHVHSASELVGPFGDIIVGDIRSAHWDGGSDLSMGMDPAATTGYFFDSSAGAIQAGVLYWRSGDATAHPATAALGLASVTPVAGVQTAATVTPAAAALTLAGPQTVPSAGTRVLPAAAYLALAGPPTVVASYPTVRSSSYGQCVYVPYGHFTKTSPSGLIALMPPDIEAGDLLVIVVGRDVAYGGLGQYPSGPFTLSFQADDGAGTSQMGVFWRAANGTEDGSWLAVCTSGNYTARFVCYAIKDCTAAAPYQAHQNGDSDSPDPPALTPAGGSGNILWIAAQVNDADPTVTAWPTNYTMNQINTTTGVGVAAACRHSTAAADNPGAFTLSAAEGWVACTVAVYPE